MNNSSFLKEPLGGKSVVSKIVDNITNAIINGELAPGDKLPTEAELSEAMGVGRNSVREAIKILEAYGVVHIKRAEGTFVSQEYDSKMIYPVLYGIILQGDASRQIMELRKVIDVGILRLAVDKLNCDENSGTYLEKVRLALSSLEKEVYDSSPQIRRIHEADVEFHMAIVAIAENAMLQAICNYVDKITRRSRTNAMDQILESGEMETFLEMHRRMVRLLEERDAGSIYKIVEEHYHYWIKANLAP